ncbi:AVN_HP_G0116020.mRNA.1.CDS.1 [Saccharomyces cerevisiae]|nr:AVN_HP_G0006620.mRNA.1.CDS.1 [Saccharomyces cerevisiae]CAI5009848.1 AVN_HP_G0051950.mRNA.1.CDS.1 [Saccharomyces cerevisiae]CAI5158330.1 AVN_HP_G0116020.mRNA.1.CDS.1 [Saccharomyces cerevisiae]CAI6611134.1 AVN_HP_G0006620.mRNA.1.CDS.1 [Saccharomyces cerevisiae]CAI6926393.1 AVN_HP_G0051950.mRNA.1.CDS.1 [Saccharomyces cerevisiae]
MKNAALCEALPLLATCSHEIPPTPHTVCFAFPPPRIIPIPEQTHTFEFASRRVALRHYH